MKADLCVPLVFRSNGLESVSLRSGHCPCRSFIACNLELLGEETGRWPRTYLDVLDAVGDSLRPGVVLLTVVGGCQI